jgi:hypothetical protein
MSPGSKAIDSAAFRWSEFNDSSIMVRVGRMVSICDPSSHPHTAMRNASDSQLQRHCRNRIFAGISCDPPGAPVRTGGL